MPDLVVVETHAVRLSLGIPSHAAHAVSREAACRAEALAHGVEAHLRGSAQPLHEETSYPLLLRSLSDKPVALAARDARSVANLVCAEGGRLWHGTLNFRSQVGPFRLTIYHDGAPHAALCGEVVPTKLGYRSDFEALRDAVDALAEGLALDALRATAPEAAPADHLGESSGAAFLAHLGGLIGALERAVHHIARRPRPSLRSERKRQRAEQIRRIDAETRRDARRQRARIDTLRAHDTTPTLATPEHAWLARHLTATRERLAHLSDALGDRSRARREDARPRGLAVLAERLDALMDRLPGTEPRDSAEGLLGRAARPTLRLRTAPGYREAFHALVGLRRALDLRGVGRAYSLRDLHALYETWCTLAVARTLAALTQQDLVPQVEPGPLGPRLRRGEDSALSFALDDAHRLVLTVQPRFRAPLLPQQPDLTLDLIAGGTLARRLVLDAKYRLDASGRARRRYGMPAPPTEALLTLHRYRDAVPGATHAAALYPWRDEPAYETSPLCEAFLTDGIGAIPMLPDHTGALTARLAAWLAEARA